MWRSSPRCAAPTSSRRGKVDTGFIDRNLAALGAVPQQRDNAAAALGVAHLLDAAMATQAASTERLGRKPASPWAARDGFQLGGRRARSRSRS